MGFNQLKKNIKIKLLAKLLAGNNVTCNICNSSYSSFLPYLNRPNAQCPNCGSLERVRLVYYFMEHLQLLNSHTRLLHIAPERCLYDIFSKKLGSNYLPADKFEEVYTYPKGTAEMDITNISMDNESVDAIICIHVLEHIQDDKKAIAELYRVLKKGGFAILQVPYDKNRATTYEDPAITSQEDRRKHFGQFDHVRIYGTDFINRFLQPGFSLEHQNFSDTLSTEVKERHVFKQQEIFLLRK